MLLEQPSCLVIGQFQESEVPEDFEAVHSHTFRVKTFKKSKHCGVCKQTLSKEGLICRVCRLACHKKCEVKPAMSSSGVRFRRALGQ
ncbi:hypothetical protein PGIGA_G00218560 [Pangasianodon gigas]|uniref:Uncharacterized protein n=1 Tax=Pangasianodon gigas TaxID=30993 RepID=A0ACC5WIG9_PANGG|nr:hypothetical protein [Pangasianodon gigas]